MHNQPDVSILITSLGDYSNNIRAINRINTNYSYEICVCSDLEIYFPDNNNFRFFKDTGSSVSAFNHMFSQSKGKYIIILNGVTLAPPNLFYLIDELRLKELHEEKFIISSASDDYGASYYIPEWAQKESGLHYRPQIIRWPCFSRETLNNHLDGVIFASEFIHHYVDNWLATFCALNGVKISENRNVRITTVPHTSITKNDEFDKEIYIKLCREFKNQNKYDIKLIEKP
jgi:hypothetical protein